MPEEDETELGAKWVDMETQKAASCEESVHLLFNVTTFDFTATT